jgi:hypothetical protein
MWGSVGPLDFVLVALAGLMSQHQQQVVFYLLAENRILKQQLGRKRLRLTDEQRRLLAVKGRALGRRVLGEVASIVTPDTILHWYRQLVARKWDHSSKRRPPVIHMLRTLVVRMAMENPGWGYDRIEWMRWWMRWTHTSDGVLVSFRLVEHRGSGALASC